MAPAFRNRSRTTSGSKKSEPFAMLTTSEKKRWIPPGEFPFVPAGLGRFFVKNPPVINMAMENPPFIEIWQWHL